MRVTLALLMALMLGACAQAPKRPAYTAAVAAAAEQGTPHTVATRVPIKAASGEVPAAARERLLARLEHIEGAQAGTLVAAMSAEPDAKWFTGNRTRLLRDGPDTFDAIFAAIESAQHSVLVESYIVDDAAIAQKLAKLLTAQHEKGREVALLYDAVGSLETDPAYFESLAQAGVQVCAYNPLLPERERDLMQSPFHRDHRKLVVVDNAVGFTGGVNVSAVYSTGSAGLRFSRSRWQRHHATVDAAASGWRDTQVEIAGPAAAQLESLFRSTWHRQDCAPSLAQTAIAPAPKAAGDQWLRIVPSRPDQDFAPIYTAMMNAIDASRTHIDITMAYFAPGTDMIEALSKAAIRGVRVRLVLPSESDFSPVLHAGRSHYDALLDAGVEIFELQGALLHAKTAVFDQVMASVGSSNLDYRSFVGNNEVNAIVLDAQFASQMTQTFEQDIASSRAVTAEAWHNRSLWQRTKELAARWLEPLW